MTRYMLYNGRAVEIYGWAARGRRIPRLYPGDKGDQPGDVAVIDDETVEWTGVSWEPALQESTIFLRVLAG